MPRHEVHGAGLDALAAADAVNGLFGIREAGCPLLADGVLIAEHPELVPDAEIVRNVHAHGAGHTGKCEAVCPQHLPIRDSLAKLQTELDNL